MEELILTAKNLRKTFGQIVAVNDISFTISRGQVVGILGPNGSGKTTTLALLLGIKHLDSGSFEWFNGIKSADANRRIGSILEVPYFYPYLNLRSNLEITARIKGANLKEIDRVLSIVDLSERSHSPYYTLSLGMKQRLALASALIGDPEVLLLDEPTNGLDPVGIAEVRTIIKEQVNRGKTIIMASHILDEVEKVCSHLLILKEGSIIAQGNVNELLTSKPIVSLSAVNMDVLLDALAQNDKLNIIEKNAQRILVSLNEGMNAAQVNQWLMERGITLNSIETHKNTLEAIFLEMVKPKNQ